MNEASDKLKPVTVSTPSGGSAAPVCPRCTRAKAAGKMFLHLSSLTWTCQQCGTHWNSDYLTGWNDGYKAAQPNVRS